MAISLNVNGSNYTFPQTGDENWGTDVTSWAQAVTTGMLQKAGGSFVLTSEVDFGANFGLKTAYIKSRATNPASSGQIRLGSSDLIAFRNSTNTGDNILSVNVMDQLQYNGTALQSALTFNNTSTVNLSASAGVVTASVVSGSISNTHIAASAAIAYSKLALSNSIVNADVSSSAAIAYAKLALSGSIVNADISTSASIAHNKMAPVLANKALISDALGVVIASSTSSTEIGYLAGVTSAVQTQIDSKVAKAGDTMTGFLTLNADPTSALHAATKQYVDNNLQGLKGKQSVRAASIANIASLSGLLTIDGVALATNDRILVKDQSTASQNGIYVASSGSWTRSTDADTWTELVSAYVFVEEGASNQDSGWMCTVNAGGTIGTTAVVFAQFSQAGIINVDGQGLIKTGSTLSLQLDGSTLSKSGTGLKVATGGITNTEVSASAAIAVSKLSSMTASKVAITDGSGFLSTSAVTPTELGYLAGVTSAVQTQINGKANTALSNLASVALNTDFNPDTNASRSIGTNSLRFLNLFTTNADITTAAIATTVSPLVKTADQSAASTNSVGLTVKTGNATGTTSNSGDLTVQTGTATGTRGKVILDARAININAQGTTDPATPAGGDIYYNTTSKRLKLYDGSTWQVLDVVRVPDVYSMVAVSSNVTLTNGKTHLVDTSVARTLTLPSPATTSYIIIKDKTGSAQTNNITVARAGTESIEGIAASKILQTNWGSWTFVSDGTNWFII